MKNAGFFIVGVVLGLGGFLILHNLGVAPLQQYDEGTYAQIVHESFERGDFLTFTYKHEVFFDKPPLYFWLAAPVVAWCGGGETCLAFAIRLPAALAGVGVLVVTMFLAYVWGRSPWFAALAGGLLIATPLFVQGAREARLDVVVALFLLLSLYFSYMSRGVASGLMLGLAILTKSVVGIFAIIPILIFNPKQWWQSALSALVVVLPWHLYETVLFGSTFWVSYVGHNVFGRYTSNLFYDASLQTDYWARLVDFTPYTLVIFLVSLVVFATWRPRSKILYVLFFMILSMVCVFFTAQTRALSYLLVVYPFAALFAAVAFSYLVQSLYVRLKPDHENKNISRSFL